MRIGHRKIVLAALIGAALTGAPAQAAEVIVVDGDHAVRRSDPVVPSRSSSDLKPPSRSGRGAGVTAGAAATSTARGRRAVRRSLVRNKRAKKISRSSYRRFTRQYCPRAAPCGACAARAARSSTTWSTRSNGSRSAAG